jgi:Na+-driven multidrug efflux pump
VEPRHQRGITQGSLTRNIWDGAWPITISRVLFLLPGVCGALWLGHPGPDAAMLPLALRYARVIFAGLIAMELVPGIGFMINAAGAPNAMLC